MDIGVYVSTRIITDPVLKLDAIFCPVSKLERFCSQIVTEPIFVHGLQFGRNLYRGIYRV